MDKLPVLWVPVGRVTGKPSPDGERYDANGEPIPVYEAAEQPEAFNGRPTAEYLPARRCKTCKHWLADRWCSSDVPGADELGGSGFCHNYKPREI